jgi:hypothetical protein
MPKTVVIDELHVTFRVPATLPDADALAVGQILTGADVMARLRRAVGVVIRGLPALEPVTFSLF